MCSEQKGKISAQMMRGKSPEEEIFEIQCPKTTLKYPSRGATGNLYAVEKRFENSWIGDLE